jgi:hypothetical protein
MHVRQTESSPTLPVNKMENVKFRRELEAYHIAAIYGMALHRTEGGIYQDNEAVLGDWVIEDYRQSYASESDPFYPSPVLKAAIRESGIDIA